MHSRRQIDMACVELALLAAPAVLNAVSSSRGGASRDDERTKLIQLDCGAPLVVPAGLDRSPQSLTFFISLRSCRYHNGAERVCLNFR